VENLHAAVSDRTAAHASGWMVREAGPVLMSGGSRDVTVRFGTRTPDSSQAPVFDSAVLPNMGRAPPARSARAWPRSTPTEISRTDAIRSLKSGLPSKATGMLPAEAAGGAD
jgi:hypothetical protein